MYNQIMVRKKNLSNIGAVRENVCLEDSSLSFGSVLLRNNTSSYTTCLVVFVYGEK